MLDLRADLFASTSSACSVKYTSTLFNLAWSLTLNLIWYLDTCKLRALIKSLLYIKSVPHQPTMAQLIEVYFFFFFLSRLILERVWNAKLLCSYLQLAFKLHDHLYIMLRCFALPYDLRLSIRNVRRKITNNHSLFSMSEYISRSKQSFEATLG